MGQWNIPSLDWEEWRDIPWYEWYYMVSNMWRVVSFKRNSIKILRQNFNSSRYLLLQLSFKGISRWYQVHRLVASAFLWLDLNSYINSDRKIALCVLHKNDIRDDNRLENLFLGTQKENIKDMVSKWRATRLIWKYNWNSKKIIQSDMDWKQIYIWDCMTDISRQFWFNQRNISEVCRWLRKSANWYRWSFVKDKGSLIIKD